MVLVVLAGIGFIVGGRLAMIGVGKVAMILTTMTLTTSQGIWLLMAKGREARKMTTLLAGLAIALLASPCNADELIAFDFSRDLTATRRAARITTVTPLGAALSVAYQDGFTESARAASWNLARNTNYFRFSFAVEADYAVDIDSVLFDSMSQKSVSSTNGPTQYDLNVGNNGAAFASLTGGWKTMPADGVWHRGVVVTNRSPALKNLTGYVTIAMAAQGARGDKSRWYVDNVMVNGRIRPQERRLVPPRVTALAPQRMLQFSNLAADQFYSVEYATDLRSDWRLFPGAANLASSGPALLADIKGLTGPSIFLRGVTSFDRLPSVDLRGFWRVTSAHPIFGGGIIRFDQNGTAVAFEQSLLGTIADDAFAMAEDGADWMAGTVAGDMLDGHTALPLAGMAATNSFQAVRYNGPMYDVWQGTNALTESQYYDPGANGYTRIGQASATASFTTSQPYHVICANTLAPIDAITGPDDTFLDAAVAPAFLTGNTSYPQQMHDTPDGQTAWIGNTSSGKKYRGFAAFGPISWKSLTVHIGALQAPLAPPPTLFKSNLLSQVFYLEYDSNGTSPVEGAEVALMFEPNGVAQLYVAVSDYGISYRGAYSYANQQLSLKFTDEDFHPNVKFALDLNSPKVFMPFDVFNPDTKGPSRWRRENASISHNLWIIFQGATVNERLSQAEGLHRARDYALALVQADAGPGKLSPASPPPDDDGRILIQVESLENGVRLTYRLANGTMVTGNVLLSGRSGPENAAPLTPSMLAGDPRVHRNVTDGTTGQDDPHEKTALLISPFYTIRYYKQYPGEPAGSFENDQALLGFSDIEEKLKSRGYDTFRLTDHEVSVEKLIHKMLSPGVVYFSSHGGSDGLLSTGTYLGLNSHKSDAVANFERLKQSLRDHGYGDLVSFRDEGKSPLEIAWVHNGMTGKEDLAMIGITPAFWSWLRTKGTDFGSSLVYIGACHTSDTPALGNAIRARTLFSFDGPIEGSTVGPVGLYLMESLARRSHSAEETYYNVLRVLRTRQSIYAQDHRLGSVPSTAADHFHGYVTLGPSREEGPNGILEFKNCGWLKADSDKKVNAGDVWWLLFAGRWGQDAFGGALGILRCWDSFWSQDKSPMIGDWCVNCSPGAAPNQAEVSYAIYLLTGMQDVPFDGIRAPRWTLNDGIQAH